MSASSLLALDVCARSEGPQSALRTTSLETSAISGQVQRFVLAPSQTLAPERLGPYALNDSDAIHH